MRVAMSRFSATKATICIEGAERNSRRGRLGVAELRHRIFGLARRGRRRSARRAAGRLEARRETLRRARTGACTAAIARRPRRRHRLFAVERADHFIRRRQIGGISDTHQHHFSGSDRTAGDLHFGHAFQQHLPGARQNAHRQLAREVAAAHALGFRQRHVVGNGRHDLHAGDEVRELGQIGQHHAGIGADVVLRAQFGERSGDVAFHQRLEQIDDADAVGEAEHLPHVFGANWASSMRNSLIEQRQTIAHRAFRCARDQSQRRVFDLDAFLGGDAAEMPHQHCSVDAAQVEALAARQHRHRHFADFSGGENEFGVRRRLFQRLQQRVEGRAGEHVHFVEDIDLVAGATPARSGWRR